MEAHPQIYVLFQKSGGPARKGDDLMSYRLFPVHRRPYIDYARVTKKLGLQPIIDQFRETGSITTMVFDWMVEEKELREILDESYNMYEYHTRRIGGKSNLGWVRIMYHSLIQQLIHGDIYYWLLYAVLREEPCLISYPYLPKFTKPGANTAFKHIDLNIAEAA